MAAPNVRPSTHKLDPLLPILLFRMSALFFCNDPLQDRTLPHSRQARYLSHRPGRQLSTPSDYSRSVKLPEQQTRRDTPARAKLRAADRFANRIFPVQLIERQTTGAWQSFSPSRPSRARCTGQTRAQSPGLSCAQLARSTAYLLPAPGNHPRPAGPPVIFCYHIGITFRSRSLVVFFQLRSVSCAPFTPAFADGVVQRSLALYLPCFVSLCSPVWPRAISHRSSSIFHHEPIILCPSAIAIVA